MLALDGAARAAFLSAASSIGSVNPNRGAAEGQDARPSQTAERAAQVTHFVGREDELGLIATRLCDPGCRLLTLVGPGGIGKTRLAVEAATQLHAEFPDGVCFVALAPVGSPSVLASTIAEALSAPLYGAADPGAQLLTFLAGKRMLVVLDNFEHLLQGARLLATLLDGAPGLKLLVTSQERLDLLQEWLLPLRGLPFPSDAHPAEAVETYSAIELFVQRAVHVQPDFALTPDVYPAVQRICGLVDGLPLGIELAAPWVRLLPCAEIAGEIAKNVDFLATSSHHVPERHRSLRAAFKHSWGLLPDAERAVFQRLSVFRGGFRKRGGARGRRGLASAPGRPGR